MKIIVTQIDEGLFAEADLKKWARSFGDEPDDPAFEGLKYLEGDPDILKYDGNKLYFMDVDLNGVKYILTSDYATAQEKEMLRRFHGGEREKHFTLEECRWDVFDATVRGIAYRGGQGYYYGIWSYNPKSADCPPPPKSARQSGENESFTHQITD